MVIQIDGFLFDTDDVYMIGPVKTEGRSKDPSRRFYSFKVYFYNQKEREFSAGALLTLAEENKRRMVVLDEASGLYRSNNLTKEEEELHMPGWDVEARKSIEGAREFIAAHKNKGGKMFPSYTIKHRGERLP